MSLFDKRFWHFVRVGGKRKEREEEGKFRFGEPSLSHRIYTYRIIRTDKLVPSPEGGDYVSGSTTRYKEDRYQREEK
jgi:hypothetical protein